MKLLNTVSNMDSFSVIIYTESLGCHQKNLNVYGNQDAGENQKKKLNDKNLQFVGTFSKLELIDSETTIGLNRCVFKPFDNVFSPYVFVAVKRIPETDTWKICEVEFT